MTTPLTGSRYEFHITRQGAGQNKAAKSYHDLYAADEDKSFNKSDDIVGHIHSIDVGSTVDGPGIRFVLFTTGCPLRCVYCHNPDTWHKANGRPVSINRIMKEIGKYEKGLRISKGGITLSGGEPLMQHDFSAEIFRRCKALGIHTCLDTSGYMSERLSDEELMNIDLVLLDIKSGDPDTHKRVTGRELDPVAAFARRLSDLKRPVWVRFVLVPGLTDDFENVEKVADICASIPSLERVEVLRFHQLGAEKWQKLHMDYPLKDTLPPSEELTERVREQFRRRGLTTY
ncbi:MAG: pyruvate formate lyase-activating protein [Synergistaceae bacterium]|nr:pyruvate formate lyase-activating protein [Synergistaceae bacterium]MBP9626650.1 pyruvate formate lyase-activating protein [Synergistaceae bacterium]MBP9958059.1 pyruvate formate lyase-activating protein [Synergistaceae bacterium]